MFSSLRSRQNQQLPPTSPAPANLWLQLQCQSLRRPLCLCLSLCLPLAAAIPVLPTGQPLRTLRQLQDQSALQKVSGTACLTGSHTSGALPDCGPSLCLWLPELRASLDWVIPLCWPRSEADQASSQDAVSSMNKTMESRGLLRWVENKLRWTTQQRHLRHAPTSFSLSCTFFLAEQLFGSLIHYFILSFFL